MTRAQLVQAIFEKRSYLLVGLDTDPAKIPAHLRPLPDAVFQFNKAIIDATKAHCIGYKINTAFYEAEGLKGWEAMQRTVEYIPATHFKIADAKRGDIGNTSAHYAKAFFEAMKFDAITVAPYMGRDSLQPFLDYASKWTIVLGLTSNAGAADFELQEVVSHTEAFTEAGHVVHTTTRRLYETVITKVAGWGNPNNIMFVAGATQASEFANIRRLAAEHFLLVPGVGAQGGSLREISAQALTPDCGLLVAASRAIIYASGGEGFAEAAGLAAKDYATEMKMYLEAFTINTAR